MSSQHFGNGICLCPSCQADYIMDLDLCTYCIDQGLPWSPTHLAHSSLPWLGSPTVQLCLWRRTSGEWTWCGRSTADVGWARFLENMLDIYPTGPGGRGGSPMTQLPDGEREAWPVPTPLPLPTTGPLLPAPSFLNCRKLSRKQ